jgi:hypothetical protein
MPIMVCAWLGQSYPSTLRLREKWADQTLIQVIADVTVDHELEIAADAPPLRRQQSRETSVFGRRPQIHRR